jgi:hypothetical protein
VASNTTKDFNTLELFTRLPNSRGDLYIAVENVTKDTVDLLLSDNEGFARHKYSIGDIMYLIDSSWVLTETRPDEEYGSAWRANRRPNVIFKRFSPRL